MKNICTAIVLLSISVTINADPTAGDGLTINSEDIEMEEIIKWLFEQLKIALEDPIEIEKEEIEIFGGTLTLENVIIEGLGNSDLSHVKWYSDKELLELKIDLWKITANLDFTAENINLELIEIEKITGNLQSSAENMKIAVDVQLEIEELKLKDAKVEVTFPDIKIKISLDDDECASDFLSYQAEKILNLVLKDNEKTFNEELNKLIKQIIDDLNNGSGEESLRLLNWLEGPNTQREVNKLAKAIAELVKTTIHDGLNHISKLHI